MITDQTCCCFLSWQNNMADGIIWRLLSLPHPHPQCPVGRRRGRQLLIYKVRQLALGPALISSLSDCDPSTFRGCTNSDNETLTAQIPANTRHSSTVGLCFQGWGYFHSAAPLFFNELHFSLHHGDSKDLHYLHDYTNILRDDLICRKLHPSE